MGRKICLLIILVILTSWVSALEGLDSLNERITEFELEAELAEKIIDQNKGKGVNTYPLEKILRDYEDAVEDFKVAVNLNNVETANLRMEDVWRVEVELKNEMKRYDYSEQKVQDNFLESLDKAQFELEFMEALINELKQKDVDTGYLKRNFYELEKMHNNVRRFYNLGDEEIAELELHKAYKKKMELHQMLESHGVKIKRASQKEKIHSALINLGYSLENTQYVIDKLRNKEQDVTKLQNNLDEINGLFNEMAELYEKNAISDADIKLQRIFILSVQLQKEIDKFDFDERSNKHKVEDAIRDFEINNELVQLVINKAGRAKSDTALTQKIFNQINNIMRDAKTLNKQGLTRDALKKINQAILLEKDFQKNLGKYVLEKRLTKQRLDKIINNYEKLSTHIHKKIEDVEQEKKLLKNIDMLMKDAKEEYERGRYQKAWKKVYKAFLLGKEFERMSQEKEIDKARMSEILNETKPNLVKAKKIISAMESQGMDVRNLQAIFDLIYENIRDAEIEYNKEEYSFASKKLKKAMVLAKKLEIMSEEVIEEYGK